MTTAARAARLPATGERSGVVVHESGDRESPVVVFVHGGGPSAVMWQGHLQRLAPRFHCLAPDLPGFGQSSRLPDISLPATADLIADLIARRAPGGRAHVVGLSYGGSVVLALLDRHPERVDRAVIDGSGVLSSWIDPLVVLGAALVSPVVGRRVACDLIDRVGLPGLGASLRGVSPRAMRRAFREGFTPRVTTALLQAPSPTLLVAGEKERTVRASNAALAALMPDAAARFVPGLGHAWLAWRHDLHVRMVEAFLEGGPLPEGLEVEPLSEPALRRVRRLFSGPRAERRGTAAWRRVPGADRRAGSAGPR